MALYLVGETIDAKSAHRRSQTLEITQLTRGVYIARADGDAEPLRYAVRIAHYLYPQAYLSSASALTLGPTSDGRLFLSGRRNQRTRLRALEIVQNAAPTRASTITAVVADELGELRIEVASPRQRFLEAFRLRSEHASAIAPELRKQMAERLIEEHGSARAAADALWALARENQWYREGEGAERYLLQQSAFVPAPAKAMANDYAVAWHGEPLGALTHDGVEWH
jgi:serine/threonine-protein kinase HipA